MYKNLARPKGTLSHTETKNRCVRLRLTARQFAETKQIANFTNHGLSQIIRKFLEDGLVKNRETIIKCRTKNYLSMPYFINNNNNNRSKTPAYPFDKLSYEKPIEELIEYIAKEDERITNKLNIDQILYAKPLKTEPSHSRGEEQNVSSYG